MLRGTSKCSLDAFTHTDLGEHSPVGQRHLLAPRLASEPANVHSPCSHAGGLGLPAFTAGVLMSGIIGLMCRLSISL